MAPLEQLLGVPDLAERILGLLLRPAELAVLSCTSRSLRAAMAELPETVWQARANSSARPMFCFSC